MRQGRVGTVDRLEERISPMTVPDAPADTRRLFQIRHGRPLTVPLVAIVAILSLSAPMAGHASAPGPDELPVQVLERLQTEPVPVASADFDEDGIPDLVSGSGTGSSGAIALHRGNADALYPNTPDARARRSAGQFTNGPFLPGARAFVLPGTPAFLHTGDFDADGHVDVIAAASGGAAVVLRGDGAGSLGPAEPIALPGAVTAMAVGEVNGPDGLADVVFGVATPTAARLLVFAGYDGAWASSPTSFDLPARATAIAIGAVDDEHESDVAVAAGQELLVIHGRSRRSRAGGAPTTPAPIERRPLPEAPEFILGGRIEPPDGGGAAALRMRLDADGRDDLAMLRPGELTPTVATTLAAATPHVVVNTNDAGAGSLRQAILAANATEGDDLITFNIPGPGPHVIVPITPLPPVVPDVRGTEGAVIIDGTSEPDFAGTPIVELSGALVGASGNGLTIASPRCVVRGLVINRFAVGILFTITVEGSPGIQDGIVEGNYIGTDVTGTVALGNGQGVTLGIGAVVDGAALITVGGTVPAARNVISANGLGVAVNGGLNRVLGNFIGTDASGTRALGNTTSGLSLNSAILSEIGGSAPGARNVISANGDDGVQVNDSGLSLIRNNYIGTDVSGSLALGNGGDGVDVPDSLLTIAGNVISANTGLGIFAPSVASQPEIIGNRIGTNSAGTAALGNGQSGIESTYTVRGNLVSGNGAHGIILHGLENVVQDNRIGTDITGTLPIGNQGDGLQVRDFVNTIGGDGDGNVIAFNGGRGIAVPLPFPVLVTILSNSIFSNGGLGIDLGGDGVTPNDACDVDEQANAPALTAVTGSPSAITITGQLNSLPSRSFLLQFFASPAPDPSGFGEGATLLGSATVVTNAACTASFSVTLPAGIAAGQFITATATRSADEFGRSATSEFSNALPFVPPSSEEAIRALMAQVQALVDNGDLTRQAGHVLMVRLRTALFFVERDKPKQATQQLRVFVQHVTVLVKTGRLDASLGQALIDEARAIIAGLETS
jgi:Right handed beta helix region